MPRARGGRWNGCWRSCAGRMGWKPWIRLADVVEAVGYVEWDHFVMEYPQLADRGREFVDRLVRAVTPTFDGRE